MNIDIITLNDLKRSKEILNSLVTSVEKICDRWFDKQDSSKKDFADYKILNDKINEMVLAQKRHVYKMIVLYIVYNTYNRIQLTHSHEEKLDFCEAFKNIFAEEWALAWYRIDDYPTIKEFSITVKDDMMTLESKINSETISYHFRLSNFEQDLEICRIYLYEIYAKILNIMEYICAKSI